MSNNDDTKRYSKEEILQYLNVVGYDVEDLKDTKIKGCKSLRLEFLHDLYNIIDAEKSLPLSSNKLSIKYEILMNQLNDDFVYPDREERERLIDDTFEILKEVSLLQVCSDDKDAYTIFERTNDILSTAVDGLLRCENITALNMIFNNSSPAMLIEKGRKKEDEQLRKLYALVALSKFDNVESDEDIFNMFDFVDEKKLYEKVSSLSKERRSYEIKRDNSESYEKVLKLRRPTLRELKESGDYVQM